MRTALTLRDGLAHLEFTAESDFEKEIIQKISLAFPQRKVDVWVQERDGMYSHPRDIPVNAGVTVAFEPVKEP